MAILTQRNGASAVTRLVLVSVGVQRDHATIGKDGHLLTISTRILIEPRPDHTRRYGDAHIFRRHVDPNIGLATGAQRDILEFDPRPGPLLELELLDLGECKTRELGDRLWTSDPRPPDRSSERGTDDATVGRNRNDPGEMILNVIGDSNHRAFIRVVDGRRDCHSIDCRIVIAKSLNGNPCHCLPRAGHHETPNRAILLASRQSDLCPA